MTSIVVALTRNYVIIGSDRRITSRQRTHDGWKILSQEDSDVKTILLHGQYAMGFCGRGRVGPERERIESWMGRLLSGIDPDQYFDTIAESATRMWHDNNYCDAQAFLGVGFLSNSSTAIYRPETVLITNSLGVRGDFDARRFGDERFVVTKRPLRGKNDVRTIGWPVAEQQLRDFRKVVRRSGNELDPNPQDVFEPMARMMGDTAESSGGFVGETFMLTSIPRAAVPLQAGVSMEMSMPRRESYLEREISLTVRNGNNGTTDQSMFYPTHIGSEVTVMAVRGNLQGEVKRIDLEPDNGYVWADEVR